MTKYSITTVDNASQIVPNFIYNRFDLYDKSDYKIYHYVDNNVDIFFEVDYHKNCAKIGLWLTELNQSALKNICKYIFKNNSNIKYVQYESALNPLGSYEVWNHFSIDLPETSEELDLRLSKKGRYNIKREKKILSEEFGGYKIEKTDALCDASKKLWDFYFKFKNKTHEHNYEMTPEEYCSTFHVTDIYSLSVGEDNKTIALVLSCEQCPIVYIENITYDTELSRYSPGQILYDEYLKELIKAGVKKIYLAGGDYDYKRRYGSVEQTVYNGTLHRYEKLRGIKNKLFYGK